MKKPGLFYTIALKTLLLCRQTLLYSLLHIFYLALIFYFYYQYLIYTHDIIRYIQHCSGIIVGIQTIILLKVLRTSLFHAFQRNRFFNILLYRIYGYGIISLSGNQQYHIGNQCDHHQILTCINNIQSSFSHYNPAASAI